ncbi:hypothetical protein TNCV_4273761 [Trichonephila clavipes]|nr:hypothetical protein TNCV_4273761 [Trichonephila clavipes]
MTDCWMTGERDRRPTVITSGFREIWCLNCGKSSQKRGQCVLSARPDEDHKRGNNVGSRLLFETSSQKSYSDSGIRTRSLHSQVLFFHGAYGQNYIFIRLDTQCTVGGRIPPIRGLERLAMTPDLNIIEHVWDVLTRSIAAAPMPIDELKSKCGCRRG